MRERLGRLVAQRLESQEDGGQRLVDLVVQVARQPAPLLLLRAQDEPARTAALLLDPAQQSPERDRQALHFLDARARQDELGRRAARVDLLEACDQRLERREAAPQEEHVDQQEEDDRPRDRAEAQALVGERQVQPGGGAGGEQHRHDQQHVDRDYLAG